VKGRKSSGYEKGGFVWDRGSKSKKANSWKFYLQDKIRKKYQKKRYGEQKRTYCLL